MKLPRIYYFVWFFVWLFVPLLGCHRSHGSSPGAGSTANPADPPRLDVTSKIVTCTTLAQCEHDCAAGNGDGCAFAGRLYEYGHGVSADVGRAFGLYDHSCALHSAVGCYNAALLLEAGRGVARDPDRAAGLYQKVCRMGAATACAHAEALGRSSP
jgi:TPR repeat protein